MKTKFFILWTIASFLSIGTLTNAEYFYTTSFTCYLWENVEWYTECNDDYLIFASDQSEWSYTLTVSATNWLTFSSYITFDPVREWQPFNGYNWYTQTFNCTSDVLCNSINAYYYQDVSWNWLVTYTVTEWWWEWWNWWEWAWWIIANGVWAFSWIITKLTGISGEFIPYIIYIAIALLWISLTINVVKYILWYLKGWAENSITGREWMKARRKRRRQQRRKTYSYEDVKRAKRKSDYYDIWNWRYKRRTIQRRKKFGYWI